MGWSVSGPGDNSMKTWLKSLSLTSKLAAVIIVANILGIAALATYSWNTETTASLASAVAKWKQDTEQFASIAAGGIKWGKPDVVRDAYTLYRDDLSLNLIGEGLNDALNPRLRNR